MPPSVLAQLPAGSIKHQNSQSWRRSEMRRSAIRQLPEAQLGSLYFQQSLTISGRDEGRPYGGEVVLDYSLASGPTYCCSRKQARGPRRQWLAISAADSADVPAERRQPPDDGEHDGVGEQHQVTVRGVACSST